MNMYFFHEINFTTIFIIILGSLISAVDPVATLAIFQALDVDPVLNMLVFGKNIFPWNQFHEIFIFF